MACEERKMITIKQRQKGNYRIIINNEEWEINSREELDKTIKLLLDKKQELGDLRE
jgi:hypothetical protein